MLPSPPIKTSEARSESSFKPLVARCAHCFLNLGEWIRVWTLTSGDETPSLRRFPQDYSIKLNKICLSARPVTHWLGHPLLIVAAQMMSRVAEAQAVRHFFVFDDGVSEQGQQSESDSASSAFLWLFQPRVRMSLDGAAQDGLFRALDLSISQTSEEPIVFEACKILYRRGVATNAPSIGGSGRSIDQAERLPLDTVFFRRLMQFLEASNAIYPESRRRFCRDWSIAWLPTG